MFTFSYPVLTVHDIVEAEYLGEWNALKRAIPRTPLQNLLEFHDACLVARVWVGALPINEAWVRMDESEQYKASPREWRGWFLTEVFGLGYDEANTLSRGGWTWTLVDRLHTLSEAQATLYEELYFKSSGSEPEETATRRALTSASRVWDQWRAELRPIWRVMRDDHRLLEREQAATPAPVPVPAKDEDDDPILDDDYRDDADEDDIDDDE